MRIRIRDRHTDRYGTGQCNLGTGTVPTYVGYKEDEEGTGTCVEAERAGGLQELPNPAYFPPWEGGTSLKEHIGRYGRAPTGTVHR